MSLILFFKQKCGVVNSYWLIVIRYWERKTLKFNTLQNLATAFTWVLLMRNPSFKIYKRPKQLDVKFKDDFKGIL
jgi:hypothetical protein